jgi:hypothetical protein
VHDSAIATAAARSARPAQGALWRQLTRVLAWRAIDRTPLT